METMNTKEISKEISEENMNEFPKGFLNKLQDK